MRIRNPLHDEKRVPGGSRIIPAQLYDAGFHAGHGNFECLYRASDGNLYYMIASHVIDTHAQMYQFDPASEAVTHIADLGGVLGEQHPRAVP